MNMILNVSGRTDIAAFYSEWFINRYKEGFLDVRNPFYPNLVSRIYFSDVDAILFCSKNPLPIIKYLKLIDKPIIFHITITGYDSDIEVNVKNKSKIIEGVKEIAKIIGQDNVYLRYDPLLLNDKYTLEYHLKAFEKLTNLLDGYVKHIIISFVDEYKNVRKNMSVLKIKKFSESDYRFIGENFSKIALKHQMTIQTCCEENTLFEYGFIKEDCLSQELAYKITGKKFDKWRTRGKLCNCVKMVDVGVYNSCKHFCKYCYANFDEDKVKDNFLNHDDNSSLLIGKLSKEDVIKVKR